MSHTGQQSKQHEHEQHEQEQHEQHLQLLQSKQFPIPEEFEEFAKLLIPIPSSEINCLIF